MQDATSGILSEVRESEQEGRLIKLPLFEYASIVDEITSHTKVIIDYDIITTIVKNDHFSRPGTVDMRRNQLHIGMFTRRQTHSNIYSLKYNHQSEEHHLS